MVPAESMADSSARRLLESGCLFHDPESPAKERSEQLMRNSDVLMLIDFVEPSPLHVPSKVFFYVRTGRPVLASAAIDSAAERILARSGIPHICLHPSDPGERVESALFEMMSYPSGPYTASGWFLETFDSSRQADTLSAWMQELVGMRTGQESAVC
jgi:hypothetical protein